VVCSKSTDISDEQQQQFFFIIYVPSQQPQGQQQKALSFNVITHSLMELSSS
jgi:hypothetical protein